MTYNDFIDGIISSRGRKLTQGYKEKHHIIPRCLGGNDEPENLIELTAKQHFVAHKLLAEENVNNKKLISAWNMMAFPKGKTKRDFQITPEQYEELRLLWSNQMKLHNNFLDENGHPVNYGKPMSEQQKMKLSKMKKGVKLGPNSQEIKQKKRQAAKRRSLENPESYKNCGHKNCVCITNGVESHYINKDEPLPQGYVYGSTKHKDNSKYKQYWTQERRKQQSIKTSGKNNPMYGKGYLISGEKNYMYGKHHSNETKQKISKANSGRKYTDEINKKKGKPGVKKPDGFSDVCRKIQSKFKYILDKKTFYGDNEIIKYIKITYNYNISSMGLQSVIENRKRGCNMFPNLVGKIVKEVNECAYKKH